MEWSRAILFPGALLAGAPPAFFLVFAGVFTDGGAAYERGLSLGLVAVAFGLLGWVFGSFEPEFGALWGFLLAVPSLVLLAVYVWRERNALPIAVLYGVTSVGAATLASGWISRRRLRARATA